MRARNGNEPPAAPEPQAILESADVGIVHLDRDFRLSYINARGADILGKGGESLTGRTLQDVVPGDFGRGIVRELERCLTGEGPVGFELVYPGPVRRWYGFRCTASGRGCTLVVQDITERRRTEEELRESRSRYHSLFGNNHAVMLLINPETGRIVDANPAAVSYYGYSREQLTSMNITDVNMLTGEQVLEEMERARQQQRRRFRFRHRLAGGEIREVEVYSGPIVVSGETLLYSIVQDITDRKRAQDSLRESVERYRILYETMAQGVMEYDEAGRLVSSNQAARQIMGLDLESMRGRPIGEVLASFSRTVYREGGTPVREDDTATIKALKAVKPVLNDMMRIYNPQRGEYRWIVIDSIPRFRPGQEVPEGFFTIFSDITAVKEAQEELKEANERLEQKVGERTGDLARAVDRLKAQREILQTVIDNIPVMLNLYDAHGTIELVNREFERLLGWSLEEVRNMDLMEAAYPDPDYRREVREYMQAAQPGWRDFEVATRSGAVLPSSWTNVRLSNGSQIGIGIDLSRRIQAERDLRKLVKAIEQAGEGIAIFSPEWVFEYVNPAYEELSGYGRGELMGRRITSFAAYLSGSGFEEVMGYVARRGKEWSGRQKRVRKDGETFDISLTVTPVYSEEGGVVNFIEVVRDVTGEVRLQEQLAQSQRLEAMGTLAGGVAHDLKNILTPIVINTEIALMDLEEGHPARGLLNEIMQAARMGNDLVRQIVTFSRGNHQQKGPVVIEPVVKEAVDFLRSVLPSTIKIHQQLSGGDAVVMADPTRIKQVVINLGGNAGHAMRETGGDLDVRLTRENLGEEEAKRLSPELRAGPYVRIMVRDTGEGMDELTMQRIFEPFFTTKKQSEGSGMGLSVVHGIVKDHQGAVTVWSRPGRGSTFSVLLPVARQDGRARPSGA